MATEPFVISGNSALSEQLLNYAKAQLEIVLPGEEFLLSDLFIGVEWKRFSKHERQLLGKNFYEYAKSEEGKKLMELHRMNPMRQQIYKLNAPGG